MAITEHDADMFASARLSLGTETVADLTGNTTAGYRKLAADLGAAVGIKRRRKD